MPIDKQQIPTDLEFHAYDTRVAAYAVIMRDDHILLAWWNGEGHSEPGWSMPGGGVDLHESPAEGVVREVREETGFDVEVTGLLAVDSHLVSPADRFVVTTRWQRSLRIVYTAGIVGGSLGTLEVGGSTDRAEWVAIAAVPTVPRVGIVDVSIAAWRAAASDRDAGSRPG